MRLADFVEISSGTPLFRLTQSKGTKSYFLYDQTNLEADLSLDYSPKPSKQIFADGNVYTLNKGDIIFSLISSKAARVLSQRSGYLYSSNFVLIHIKAELDANFLLFLLNENSKIRSQFYANSQGLVAQKISVKALREIKIPALPPLKTQQKIGEIYLLFNQLQAVKKRNLERQSLALNTLLQSLINKG